MASDFSKVTLLDALLNRRSRRVGLGMSVPAGPFRYASRHKPIPLTEEEEAALAFAACGVTGYALADLSYGADEGGGMLVGRLGRTAASADAANTVAVVVTNDHATYLLKRPQDFTLSIKFRLSRISWDVQGEELGGFGFGRRGGAAG